MRSRTLNEEVRDAMAVLEKSLRLAAPMYEAVGASLKGIDTIHVPEFLCRAVVGMRPSRLRLRHTAQGFTIFVEGQARQAYGHNSYVAVALVLAAHMAAAGRWELVPGVEAPLMAAATVVLANGWARVGP